MAELKLMPIGDTLAPEDVRNLNRLLKELGAGPAPHTDESLELDEVLSENQLADFFDRLEAHEMACDIYLPLEFEGRLEVGDGQTIGSTHALLEALNEIRDELNIFDDSELEYYEALYLEIVEEQLTYAWHTFTKAANACIEQHIPLHVMVKNTLAG